MRITDLVAYKEACARAEREEQADVDRREASLQRLLRKGRGGRPKKRRK